MRAFLFTILVGGVASTLAACNGCSDPPEPPGTPCSTTADCELDEICVDGTCMAIPPGVDAGIRRDSGAGCTDLDGDGYGDGCAAGPDCDDSDRTRGGPERCDSVDNDCDGTTDEGLAELCGAECTPDCSVTEHPGPGGFVLTPENSDGVIVDDEGALTLGREMSESYAIWVANMDDGTVSKLDSRTNVETARYPTVGDVAIPGMRPWNEACNWSNQGNCPSRTAVDQRFDAYVANRAFGSQGTVTKYAGAEEGCIDRNMNGMIETSRDLNADGSIDMSPAMGEFVGPTDECILWTAPVGASDSVPRALAVGLAPPDGTVGNVWVGLFNARQACQLSPSDGTTIGCLDVGGFQSYGAVADAAGRIWLADRSSSRRDILGYIDPAALTFTAAPAVPGGVACGTSSINSYGVTVDADGKIYVASSDCAPGLLRYDPATSAWTAYDLPGGGTARGVAADETSLWVAISHVNLGFGGGWASRVLQFDLTDMSFVARHDIPTGTGPVGVGVSFDGSVWAVCQGSNTAARLDPPTGTWIEHGVGLTPYTYSDFIGFGLNTFAQPRGWYRFVVEGCPAGGSSWLAVRYEGEVPPMTSVEFHVRAADTRADLAAASWLGPFTGNPANLTLPPGPVPGLRFLEVEVRLRTEDRTRAPRIFSMDVAVSCGPILG